MALNKSDLIAEISSKSSLSKQQVEAALAGLQDVLVESLAAGEQVKLTGVFSAERVERSARTGRNPRTGEEIQIPASHGVKITAGSILKKAVADK